MENEASYICKYCGEDIVVPIDWSAGSSQQYVEDCSVCCNPNIIHIQIGDTGDVQIWGEAEQDQH
ncbi:MAG TPA: CPXCG motif-containing cysteine-rich protein [Planctomycetes bacterium]|nr:CPXCG motif-containing cysteine-rich protein [Planctomycetaceae bacterium]HIM28172.1 CPXCG motif-containing cysteine-rich protein [Planctomycetota bacterium]